MGHAMMKLLIQTGPLKELARGMIGGVIVGAGGAARSGGVSALTKAAQSAPRVLALTKPAQPAPRALPASRALPLQPAALPRPRIASQLQGIVITEYGCRKQGSPRKAFLNIS